MLYINTTLYICNLLLRSTLILQGRVFERLANGKTFGEVVCEIVAEDQRTFLNNMRLARCDANFVKLVVTGSIVNTTMQILGDGSSADYKQQRAAWTSICVPKTAFMDNGRILDGGFANYGPALTWLFAMHCLAIGSVPKGGIQTIRKCLQQQVSEPGHRNKSLGKYTRICHGMNVSVAEADETALALDHAAQLRVWQGNELFAAATAAMKQVNPFLNTDTVPPRGGHVLVRMALNAEDKAAFSAKLSRIRAAAANPNIDHLAFLMTSYAKSTQTLDVFCMHLEFWRALDGALEGDDPAGAVAGLLATYPDAVHETHESGYSLLHLVLAKKAPENVVLMVLRGHTGAAAETDADSHTPLHIALRFCQQYNATGTVVTELVRAWPAAVAAENKYGYTPLQLGLSGIARVFAPAIKACNLKTLASIVSGVGSLFQNPDLRPSHLDGQQLKSLLGQLMTCVLHKSISKIDDHWRMRDMAAQVTCTLCTRYGPSFQTKITTTMTGALLDATKPLATHYGAIAILGGFGVSVVDMMLTSVTKYAPSLKVKMADADPKIRADATKVRGAILAVLDGYTQLPAIDQCRIDTSLDLFRE